MFELNFGCGLHTPPFTVLKGTVYTNYEGKIVLLGQEIAERFMTIP